MVASCMSLTDNDRTAGLYAVGVRGDIQRQGYGLELVRRVTASLRGQADFITLQCHPMLAAFYGKVGFERVGAVEAWSRSQGRIPVDATEAALITAICGADVTLLQQLLTDSPARVHQPVMLWNRGATLLHLAVERVARLVELHGELRVLVLEQRDRLLERLQQELLADTRTLGVFPIAFTVDMQIGDW